MLTAGIVVAILATLVLLTAAISADPSDEKGATLPIMLSAMILALGAVMVGLSQSGDWDFVNHRVAYRGKVYAITELKAEYVPVDKKGQANAQEEAAQPGK